MIMKCGWQTHKAYISRFLAVRCIAGLGVPTRWSAPFRRCWNDAAAKFPQHESNLTLRETRFLFAEMRFHRSVWSVGTQFLERLSYQCRCVAHKLSARAFFTRVDMTSDRQTISTILLPLLKSVRSDVYLIPFLCDDQQNTSQVNCLLLGEPDADSLKVGDGASGRLRRVDAEASHIGIDIDRTRGLAFEMRMLHWRTLRERLTRIRRIVIRAGLERGDISLNLFAEPGSDNCKRFSAVHG